MGSRSDEAELNVGCILIKRLDIVALTDLIFKPNLALGVLACQLRFTRLCHARTGTHAHEHARKRANANRRLMTSSK